MSQFTTSLKARRHGARRALTIIQEADRAGLHRADAFALVEQESGFRNIFGHDPGGLFPGQRVTFMRVQKLIQHVRNGGISNGVGFTQLTFIGFIMEAQKMGGAQLPRFQMRVAFQTLAGLQRIHGRQEGFARYNGSGPDAEQYGRTMMLRSAKWREFIA